ncbi:hypothetical protein [Candidatus Electronema sp. JC]|uniref:hypothetical protein n=1 Tax=Candidatus Electronema sp. JC TaxID=3401570 RepID=UPI003B433CB4
MNIDSTSASPAIKRDTALEKKLDSYLMLTGINDKVTARSLAQRHFSAHAGQYPYLLFRGRTLYLFTADGLSAAKQLPGTNTADYLRFDGERISRLDPLYYLGPAAEEQGYDDDYGGGDGCNNNNNNNNNNNGNNNNNNG